jgi:hypothetical protein
MECFVMKYQYHNHVFISIVDDWSHNQKCPKGRYIFWCEWYILRVLYQEWPRSHMCMDIDDQQSSMILKEKVWGERTHLSEMARNTLIYLNQQSTIAHVQWRDWDREREITSLWMVEILPMDLGRWPKSHRCGISS